MKALAETETTATGDVAEVSDCRVPILSRCSGCGLLLGKIFFTVAAPKYMYSITEVYPDLEIKVETQVKCRKCKSFSHQIFVV